VEPPTPARSESLAAGAPGIALWHIERARTGFGAWRTAHQWLIAATREPVSASLGSGLFRGAPAVAYALAAAGHPAYALALRTLNRNITALVRRRLQQAHTRIDRDELPTLAEFDLINGLTGIGCYLLNHQPDDPTVSDILTYLVRLTGPLRLRHMPVPGWWTTHSPADQHSPHFPNGHGNLGLAHGISVISGVKSVLAGCCTFR
jgi:hypothetical protein